MIKSISILILFLSLSLLFISDAYPISKKLELAEKLYLQGDYSSAAYECERLLREHKVGDFRNDVAYLAGLSYFKLNDFSKSAKYFETVLNNSNDPLLVHEAQIGLENILAKSAKTRKPSLFSIQVGCFKHRRNAERL